MGTPNLKSCRLKSCGPRKTRDPDRTNLLKIRFNVRACKDSSGVANTQEDAVPQSGWIAGGPREADGVSLNPLQNQTTGVFRHSISPALPAPVVTRNSRFGI
jgi:hypothetical protein